MGKNATIEKIISVYPHTNADKLELIKILGYQCVVPKGKYNINDLVIYIRPDSVLPDKEWCSELKRYAPKRIKAIKLRDEWSEGLVVDVNILKNISDLYEGKDISDELEIVHYEPPIPNDIDIKGLIPFNIPVTDEERWENIPELLPYGENVDITLKIDGQSCSYFYSIEHDRFGVIGRKFELKRENVNKYTYHLNKLNVEEKLKKFCLKHNVSLCIRGESYGNEIQKSSVNPHSKMPNSWKMFSVWNIKERRYERKGDKFYFLNICEELGLPHVDVVESNAILTPELVNKYSVELKELNNTSFEGVVIQHSKGSFKILNKYYDSKK